MDRIKDLRKYGLDTKNRTYVIAEIGLNHGGDIKKAKALIDSAARTGVDAVKFQTYITEKRAPKGKQDIYKILQKCELPFSAFKELKSYAEQHNLVFFSTAFDRESVEHLESMGCDIYKIASFDVVNHKLLSDISKTRKTVIMSVGMANLDEITEAYNILRKGTDKIVFLHCISAYPLKEEEANLAAVYTLQERFSDCVIGYSDHTDDIHVPLYAVAAGAQVIEKHYKIDEVMDCVDAAVSITEAQTRQLVVVMRKLEKKFGDGKMGVRSAEKGTTIFRRPTRCE